ncbi:HAD-IB family hydrolase [Litoribacillus peritrichatus]|uniref:HAD-IB family hydrolase n=1 Tax=Litoribacillus peritrichatus TaxID=718191 RepID=A0ABP7M6N0_9GAMM
MKWLHNQPNHPAYAFFDVDNTLITIKSMFSFLEYLWSEDPELFQKSEEYRSELNRMIETKQPRENINEFYYSIFQGISVNRINELSHQWYLKARKTPNFFIEPVVDILNRHKDAGHGVILVSGSALPLLLPLAKELNVDGVISAPLEKIEGHYTGRLVSEPSIGQGKAKYIKRLLSDLQQDPSLCYAYGDDVSDIPMLKTVGQAAMINPTKESTEICDVFGWNLIQAA